MKTTLILMGLFAGSLAAQTSINKTVPVSPGQNLKMNFDYPEKIRISTWEKNEISIQGTVSINGGENDEAFSLEVNNTEGSVMIKNLIKNMKSLPERITVMKDGNKTTFRNKSEWKKYQEEHGKSAYNMINQGVDMDIELEIKVPANLETSLVSVYGMVEVKNFKGPLIVEATYGGVDATLTESSMGELIAETNYGHIYSGLVLKFDASNTREEDFHTLVNAKPGVGPRYRFESPYGNVYLRKSN